MDECRRHEGARLPNVHARHNAFFEHAHKEAPSFFQNLVLFFFQTNAFERETVRVQNICYREGNSIHAGGV